MADREIPVFSIILASHASTKRARLSRVFLQRISSCLRLKKKKKKKTRTLLNSLLRLTSLSKKSNCTFHTAEMSKTGTVNDTQTNLCSQECLKTF